MIGGRKGYFSNLEIADNKRAENTRRIVIVFGAILIALGVIIYLVLPMVTSTQSIVSQETFTVSAGSGAPRAFHLPSGADVSGTINQVVGQSTNDIDFYVFDRTNYQNWVRQQSSVWYVSSTVQPLMTNSVSEQIKKTTTTLCSTIQEFSPSVKGKLHGLLHTNTNPMWPMLCQQ